MFVKRINIPKSMELQEYLTRIAMCPDDQLIDEHRVSDNYPILFNLEFKDMLQRLERTGRFRLSDDQPWHVPWITEENWDRTKMEYIPGTVVVQCLGYNLTDIRIEDIPGIEEHRTRQLTEFTSRLLLHPYKNHKMDGCQERAIAYAIADIGEMILSQNIKACFPLARGHKYRNDLSRIVYHP